MLLSAEIRWFGRGSLPPQLVDWFCKPPKDGFAAGGGAPEGRRDDYLWDPNQTELGVKNRGGGAGVEVKSLVSPTAAQVDIPPFVGPIEFWTKVSSATLKLNGYPLISLEKIRWLRKFDTDKGAPVELKLNSDEKRKDSGPLPHHGCNVELTEVTISSTAEKWWTFGFEAFGILSTIENSLKASALLMSQRNPPPLTHATLASYPTWLASRTYHHLPTG